MSAFRYLMNIAYIGAPFRGSQRQVAGTFPRINDPLTVQGCLEMALKNLRPHNEPVVYLSSRTDSGVNALNVTCQVDLCRQNTKAYDPRIMTVSLNRYFTKENVPIRILKTYLVPTTFNCRHNALSRTYLYRIIVGKPNADILTTTYHYIPIEEWNRAFFYCSKTFNMDKMMEGAKLLEGFHDFRSFMGKGSLDKITRRSVEYIKIEQAGKTGYSPYSWPNFAYTEIDDYMFLNIYIKSSGFLYRQVRRIVAALVALADGKVTIRDIKFMLEIPSRHSWCPQLKTAPAHGLYLCQVEYSKEDLDTFRADLESDLS